MRRLLEGSVYMSSVSKIIPTSLIRLTIKSMFPIQKLKVETIYGGASWLSFRDFFGGIYCYANFFCYADFSIVFGTNFEGQKSLREGKCLRGRSPSPVEESQQEMHNLPNLG